MAEVKEFGVYVVCWKLHKTLSPHPTHPILFQILKDCTIGCKKQNVTCQPPKHQANQIPNYLSVWLGGLVGVVV